MKFSPSARAFALASVLLLAAGAVLLWLAAITPWHTDSDAYFRDLNALRATVYPDYPEGRANFEGATERFQALQEAYATHKWLYADLAYLSLGLGGLSTIVTALVARYGARLLRTQRKVLIVLGVAVLALTATLTGLIAMPLHYLHREQVPEWSDSIGIPLASAVASMITIGPVVLVLVLAPLIFRRRVAGPVLTLGRRPYWASILVSLVYALPIAFALFLVICAFSPGGWALTPAGLLLLWLFLNARALWIAPEEGVA